MVELNKSKFKEIVSDCIMNSDVQKILVALSDSERPLKPNELHSRLSIEIKDFDRAYQFCQGSSLIKSVEMRLNEKNTNEITNCTEITTEGVKFLIDLNRYEREGLLLEETQKFNNETVSYNKSIKTATIWIAIATVVSAIATVVIIFKH